ncbi:hypothetical protein ACQKWADRAFT_291946 [Trichoderma austrokoningii]
MNLPLAKLEDRVAEACAAHESDHHAEDNYRAAMNIGTNLFVKYGDVDRLLSEMETQKYISNHATASPGPDVPRIPRVLHWFQRGDTAYLVMEYIQLQPTSETTDGVSAALAWLARVPAPPGHVLGPLGGGYIRHPFFKDDEAPLRFSSVDALQRYMDRAYDRLLSRSSREIVPRVTIKDDALMFCQGDIDDSNFGLDDEGRTVLLDFADIGLVPATFVAFTLASPAFASTRAALGLSNEQSVSMAYIRSVLHMAANPELGLDKDGNTKARPVKESNVL